MNAVLLYALAWLLFAFIHSSFARQSIQKKIEPLFKGSYRLLYNIFSLIQFLALLELGQYLLDTQTFALISSAVAQSALLVLKILGLVIIVLALAKYDLGRFSGFTQVRTLESLAMEPNEDLHIKGLNSWVRHPLYSGAFLYFWGGADSLFGVSTAIFASLYLIVGTVLEERKLLNFYGSAYQTYQKDVPRFFPLKLSMFQSTSS